MLKNNLSYFDMFVPGGKRGRGGYHDQSFNYIPEEHFNLNNQTKRIVYFSETKHILPMS